MSGALHRTDALAREAIQPGPDGTLSVDADVLRAAWELRRALEGDAAARAWLASRTAWEQAPAALLEVCFPQTWPAEAILLARHTLARLVAPVALDLPILLATVADAEAAAPSADSAGLEAEVARLIARLQPTTGETGLLSAGAVAGAVVWLLVIYWLTEDLELVGLWLLALVVFGGMAHHMLGAGAEGRAREARAAHAARAALLVGVQALQRGDGPQAVDALRRLAQHLPAARSALQVALRARLG